MAVKAPDGSSMAAHYAAAAKRGRKAPEPPPLPEVAQHAWNVFLRLHRGRPQGFGPSGIPWSEIDAYCRVSGDRLEPWEADVIAALDAEYLRSQAASSPS